MELIVVFVILGIDCMVFGLNLLKLGMILALASQIPPYSCSAHLAFGLAIAEFRSLCLDVF